MNYIKRLTAFILCIAVTLTFANVNASADKAVSADAVSSDASANASSDASCDASKEAQTTTETVSGEATTESAADKTTEAATTKEAKTTEKPKATTEKTLLEDMSVGLHKNADGKIYYAKKNGKKAKGYKKVGKAEYYFDSDGYALVKKWKYVKLNKNKYKLYFGANGKRVNDVSKLMKKNTRYSIDVILNKCMIMIYAKDGNKGYTIPVKAMTCSPGVAGHETITGTYKIRRVAAWHTLFFNSYGQYATNIHGNFLFHSVCYTKYGDHYSLSKKAYSELGNPASHGCIRLLVKDAKWIYDHAGNVDKTTLRKGSKNTKTPLAKPTTKKIGKTPDGRYYDPTDPNIN